MKRSKNIFDSKILPESLYDEEGERQFRVGEKEVRPNWLVGVQKEEYLKYINSAMHLSELQKHLQQLKEAAQVNKGTLRQSNLFQIANLKKKIMNFQPIDTLPKQQQQKLKQQIAKKEPPDCSRLIMQKIAGFLNTSYERKCKIVEKQLFIQTKKDNQNPFAFIDINMYTMEIENKEKPLNRKEFELYLWLPEKSWRMLLYGQNAKPYCIYGSQEDLRKVHRYYQVQHIQIKKLSVFQKLNTQFEQKIITLFGNKVRLFEHNRQNNRTSKQILNKFAHTFLKDGQLQYVKQEKQVAPQNNLSNSIGSKDETFSQNASQMLSQNMNAGNIQITPVNSEIMLQGRTPLKTPQKNKDVSGVFKLRARSSTVFYDEIEPALTFDDKQIYTVNDINLNMGNQGMSEVDEESHSLSSPPTEMKKKIHHYTLINDLDNNQKFNVNIFEVSVSPVSSERLQSGAFERLSRKGSDGPFQLNRIGNMGDISKIRKTSQDSKSLGSQIHRNFLRRPHHKQLGQLILDNFQEDEAHHQNIEEMNLPSSRSSSSSGKGFSKTKQPPKSTTTNNSMKYFEVERPLNMHICILRIDLFLPHYESEFKVQILQLDYELQMDKTYVYCSKAESIFGQTNDNSKVEAKYMRYAPKDENGLNFRISSQSSEFVLILKNQIKDISIPFTLTCNQRYQINNSKLLFKQVDKFGYAFAGKLSIYISPEQIRIPPKLTTIEFLMKYLKSQHNDYQLKHEFINEKRIHYQLNYEWNKKIVKEIINEGDLSSFSQATFRGLPPSIYLKLKKMVEHQFQQDKLFNFTENDVRLIEDNIISSAIYDIRVFMKPSALITKVSTSKFNEALIERFKQVYVLFLNKYDSARNLSFVFIKEILAKIQSVILLARKEDQVDAILKLYFEVEYEIDQIFEEVSKYFKK